MKLKNCVSLKFTEFNLYELNLAQNRGNNNRRWISWDYVWESLEKLPTGNVKGLKETSIKESTWIQIMKDG